MTQQTPKYKINSLPEFQTYGDYTSDNYGAHALQFFIGPLVLWYSYQTVVAFKILGKPVVVSENIWGPTTGRHLNWIDPDHDSRLPREEFEKRLKAALNNIFSD